MSENTYAKWGRKKVKGLDFDKKIVKILDFNQHYTGWDSGIAIINFNYWDCQGESVLSHFPLTY